MKTITARFNPAKIRQERWEAVYDDCLLIAKDGHLADVEKMTIKGHEMDCLVPVTEKDGEVHIRGDMVYGRYTEGNRFIRDIGRYYPDGKYLDMDLPTVDYLYNVFSDENSHWIGAYMPLPGTQTFEATPHKHLLAIAVLIAGAFPGAAVIYGDVTVEQINEARDLIEKITGKRVMLPIQFDYEMLYSELENRGYRRLELLRRFMKLYKGEKSKEYKWFVKCFFTESFMTSYYCRYREYDDIYNVIKDWLEYGMSLDGLCDLFKRIQSDFDATILIDYLIMGGVESTEKEKELLPIKSRKIDAYIPGPTLTETVFRHFPDRINTIAFQNAYDGNSPRFDDARNENAFRILCSGLCEDMGMEDADIKIFDQLCFWNEKMTTISEPIKDKIVIRVKNALEKGGEMLKKHNSEDIGAYIAGNIRNKIALPPETAEYIIGCAADEEKAKLYIGLLNDFYPYKEYSSAPVVQSLLMKPELADYALQLAKDDENGNQPKSKWTLG